METLPDARGLVGATVNAKYTHITSFKECQRIYGALAKSKRVSGTVLEVLTSTVNGRARNLLKVEWDLYGRKIVKTLGLCCVKARWTSASELDQRERSCEPPPSDSEDGDEDCQHQLAKEGAHSSPGRGCSDVSGESEAVFDCHGVEWVNKTFIQPVGGMVLEKRWTMVSYQDKH